MNAVLFLAILLAVCVAVGVETFRVVLGTGRDFVDRPAPVDLREITATRQKSS